MEEGLFQKSFHAVWQNMLKQAAGDVQKLDRKLFNDPALGGHLQEIAARYEVEVARFEGEPRRSGEPKNAKAKTAGATTA